MKTNERKNDARDVQSFKKMRRLLSAAAVLLLAACLVLTAPVGANYPVHGCTQDDYCLVCDVAAKINALPETVTVENAADVTNRIHAIDRIKFDLTDNEYGALLNLVEHEENPMYGLSVPTRYMNAVSGVYEVSGEYPSFTITKSLVSSEGLLLDISNAQIEFEITRVGDDTFQPLMLTLSDLPTANVQTGALHNEGENQLNNEFAAISLNAILPDMYSSNTDGWTYTYILPAGTYTITEISESGLMMGGTEVTSSSTTIRNGDTTVSGKTTIFEIPAGSGSVSILITNEYHPPYKVNVVNSDGNPVECIVSCKDTSDNSVGETTAGFPTSDVSGLIFTVTDIPEDYAASAQGITIDLTDEDFKTSVSGSGTGYSYQVTQEDAQSPYVLTIILVETPKYTIQTFIDRSSDQYGGEIDACVNGVKVTEAAAGETVTLVDRAWENSTIFKYFVNKEGSTSGGQILESYPYSFTMPAYNVDVYGWFQAGYYDIIIDTSIEHGTVVSSADKQKCRSYIYLENTENGAVYLTFTPESGYVLKSVLYRGEDEQEWTVHSGGAIIMPEKNIVISAEFVEEDTLCDITIDDSIEYGTVTISSNKLFPGTPVHLEQPYDTYGVAWLTVTPDQGYVLDSVSYRGIDETEWEYIYPSDGSFDMPDKDIVISATFIDEASVPYMIYVAGQFGTITSTHERASIGTPVTLTLNPNDGYYLSQFMTVLIDTQSVEDITDQVSNSEYTFSMPGYDVGFVAVFSVLNPFAFTVVDAESNTQITSGVTINILDKDKNICVNSLSIDSESGYIIVDEGWLNVETEYTVQVTNVPDGSGVPEDSTFTIDILGRITSDSLNPVFTEDGYYLLTITLYPQHTLTFNSNGGTGSMESVPFTHGYSVPDCAFTAPEGHEFVSWNTESDGTGYRYSAGDTIENPSDDITLYAVWEPKTYTVTFNANGGSGSMNPLSFEHGESETIPECSFTAPLGKMFACWNTAADGTGICYNKGDIIENLSDDILLYAVWQGDNTGGSPVGGGGNDDSSTTPDNSGSSGSATDTGSGNYSEYPRTTENGGEVGFGTSSVVIKVILPEGTKGEVTLLTKPDTPDTGNNDVYYDFELDIPNYPEGGEGKVIWKIPASDLNEETGEDDYGVYVFDGDEWKPLETTWEKNGTDTIYTTGITSDGNFIIVKEKGISEKAETDAPVVVPGDEPQDTPDEVLPPSSGDDKPDEKEEEQKIPVLGLGIGLLLLILVIAGIVFAVRRRK